MHEELITTRFEIHHTKKKLYMIIYYGLLPIFNDLGQSCTALLPSNNSIY